LKKYEVTLLLDDRKNEDGGAAFIKEVEALLIKLGGSLTESTGMGRKQVIAPIRKRHTAYYWYLVVELDGGNINTLRDAYRLDERVLRFQGYLYNKPEKLVLLPRKRPGDAAPAAPVEAAVEDRA
jgi:ribosomal protein S6